jgi:hypothetical protein
MQEEKLIIVEKTRMILGILILGLMLADISSQQACAITASCNRSTAKLVIEGLWNTDRPTGISARFTRHQRLYVEFLLQ